MRFHPAVALAYVGLLVLVALLFSHPLRLAALAVVVGAGLAATGALRSWWGSLKLLWPAALLIVVLNPLVVREGATVLWHGPRLPLLGHVGVSLEALVFGLVMVLRLLLLTGAFFIYQRLVEPDDLLALVGRTLPRAGVMLALATRLVPTTAATYREVGLAQAARGVDFRGGGRMARLKHHLLLIKGLLLSSLERALDLAEAMQARAFGSGPRTAFVTHIWRPRDTAALVALAVALMLLLADLRAWSFNFYPRLDPLLAPGWWLPTLVVAGALLTPPLLELGWRRWPWLRSKI